ncbi:verprolin isoform X2 [Hippoglossus hippoglossus]|uniref:verprolin isoform X2 n=1 Tax=Hippoglossus hippoglossus TaxID=8267 RepID=UPI00148D5A5C|nr:verprolin isoform X2 [Hippoglossus hippoglossus]XP_035014115.1 verprolin isoform X2 [Hippoglossus stenolepis]
MASMQDGLNFTAPPYGKVLLLGAIAAASAFVVTILIVVLCVGCQRKGKTHNVPGEGGKHRLMDMGILRQSKLRSISKSDTEMNKMNCNGKSRAGQTDTPAPPAVPANTPAPPDPDGDVEGGLPEPETQVMTPPHPPEAAEYACVRKLRKADKAPQKRDSGTDMAEPPVPPPRHAPPSHPAPPPPHPHSTKLPRRNVEAFSVPSFPKEVMFMGNGEQYIWKPPEEEELLLLQNKALGPLGAQTLENLQPSAAAVAEMYSKVCKTGKKKRAVPGSPPANPGFRTLGRGDRDGGFSVVVKPQTWAPLEGKAIGGPLDDHCYESIGTEEYDPSYEHMEGGGGWKRERPPNTCATLRPRRKKAQQPLQQQQPPPPPPTQQTPKLQHLPAKALLLPGENLYESIGDLKQGSATSSTTTIFTFNDGMEMYVTGL